MSVNQIDKLFNKFYESVYKVFNDQLNNKRYLTRNERMQLESEKARRESEEKKISELCEFNCEICLDDRKSEDGMKLSECYHTFCKQCLHTYINNNSDGYLICPNSNCTVYLKDFQIKSLLSESEYYNYKLRCLKQIEGQLGSNGFHCKTLDCIGFCVIEKPSNRLLQKFFQCPICNETNCIECDAIHRFKTCHEYRHEVANANYARDQNAERESIEILIRTGEIMKCPKCSILLQRDSGMCQYIRCYLCKMDICWLTRGPRWGPGGKGDLSGGCRCGFNGIRCHPDCTNCH